MRILLVEDDQVLASFIVKGFKEAGFAVDCCYPSVGSVRARRFDRGGGFSSF